MRRGVSHCRIGLPNSRGDLVDRNMKLRKLAKDRFVRGSEEGCSRRVRGRRAFGGGIGCRVG